MKSALEKSFSKALARLSSPKEWDPGRYRRIGLAMRKALEAAGYTRHDKHGDKVLKRLAENTLHLTEGEKQRPSTYFYLCLQVASDLIPDRDFEIYREHQLSWDQIRTILRALGHGRSPQVQQTLCTPNHCGLTEAQAALRDQIRCRLSGCGRDGFTDYMNDLSSWLKKLKRTA